LSDSSRTEKKRELTRAALIEATRDLVFERGHDKISIQDITDRADVGLGTFYNYFESKTDVFEAVAEQFVGEFRDRLALVRAPVKDPATLIAVTIRFCCEETLNNLEWNQFLIYSGLPQLKGLIQDPQQGFEDLQNGAKGGRFKVENVDFAHKLITSMVDHVIEEMTANRLGRSAVEDVCRYILRMLGLPDLVAKAIAQGPMPPIPAPKRHRPMLSVTAKPPQPAKAKEDSSLIIPKLRVFPR